MQLVWSLARINAFLEYMKQSYTAGSGFQACTNSVIDSIFIRKED